MRAVHILLALALCTLPRCYLYKAIFCAQMPCSRASTRTLLVFKCRIFLAVALALCTSLQLQARFWHTSFSVFVALVRINGFQTPPPSHSWAKGRAFRKQISQVLKNRVENDVVLPKWLRQNQVSPQKESQPERGYTVQVSFEKTGTAVEWTWHQVILSFPCFWHTLTYNSPSWMAAVREVPEVPSWPRFSINCVAWTLEKTTLEPILGGIENQATFERRKKKTFLPHSSCSEVTVFRKKVVFSVPISLSLGFFFWTPHLSDKMGYRRYVLQNLWTIMDAAPTYFEIIEAYWDHAHARQGWVAGRGGDEGRVSST